MTLLEPADVDFLSRIVRGLHDPELEQYAWALCGREKCDGQPHEGMQRKHPRPEQVPPDDVPGWHVYFFRAGRGAGKSRAGAEWIKKHLRDVPGSRWAVVAPTFGDARDTCIEGESGLLSVLPPGEVKTWNRSIGELVHVNGSRVKLFSGDEPDRLRGPQHHGAWVDELSSFRYDDTWDQLQFGLRLGTNPRVFITSTPKPTALVRKLIERNDGSVLVRTGSTFDNAGNLAASAVEEMRRRYEGTRLGRQELHGELLLDVPGALATYEQLDAGRIQPGAYVPEFTKRCAWVDPAVTNTDDSDSTGITVQARSGDDVYLLADVSLKADVEDWAMLAVATAIKWHCGTLGYEANQGGDSIGVVLARALQRYNQLNKTNHVLRIIPVTAKQSKYDRALPMQLAIQQRSYHLVGTFPELESQLTTWVPEDEKGRKMPSPNNLDSAVHGYRWLMNIGGDTSVGSYQRTTLPGRR